MIQEIKQIVGEIKDWSKFILGIIIIACTIAGIYFAIVKFAKWAWYFKGF